MIIAGITVSGGCEENDILYGSDNFCNLITYFKVLKLPGTYDRNKLFL